MGGERIRDGYIEPKWSIEERNRLADEWAESDSELDIQEYVLAHASDRFRQEYERARQIISKAS